MYINKYINISMDISIYQKRNIYIKRLIDTLKRKDSQMKDCNDCQVSAIRGKITHLWWCKYKGVVK